MKWEYCVIPRFSAHLGWFDAPEVWFPRPNGCEVVPIPIKGKPRGVSKHIDKKTYAAMQVLARLGELGWELAGCGSERTDGDHHTLYFKRAIEFVLPEHEEYKDEGEKAYVALLADLLEE